MGVAPQWIEKPEKLLVFILAIVAKKEQNNYGILYLLYIDNVLFAIQIFGRLMLVFFLRYAISQLVKTLRQRVSRIVRKTLSFSKKLENHIGAIWYFIHHYNYVLSQ
jgi:hypothetical protein